MSTEASRFLRQRETIPSETASVERTIEAFQSIQIRALHWMLRFLPWVIIFEIGKQLLGILPFSAMNMSGWISAALMLFAFQVLLRRIPQTLSSLWNRKIIAVRSGGNNSQLEEQYQKFIHGFESYLNHDLQWAAGLGLALILFWRVFFTHGTLENLFLVSGQGLLLLELIGQPLIGFLVGIMVWRMLIVGMLVWQLGKRFDLIPQLGHPDKCGGLEPLGNLCLWNALILGIPGLYLGGWIIVGPKFFPWTEEYIPFLSAIAFMVVITSGISFFLPLWSIHQVMLARRRELQQQLDQLGEGINRLRRKMLCRAEDLQPEESEEMAKKLELMQKIYQENQHIPVWPFNIGIISKFLVSQAVPLASLLGLRQPIVNLISSIMDFLTQSPMP